MIPSYSRSYELTLAERRRPRPLSVSVISIFQFSRASIVFIIVVYAGVFHMSASDVRVRILTYITAGQALPPPVLLPIIMPLVGGYLFATGMGLWFLRKWARNILMITSSATAFMWIRAFVFYGALGEPIFESELQQQTVMVVVLLDILVFAYLYLHGAAFGETD